MSEKHLVAKIAFLEEKDKRKNAEIRKLRQRNSALEISRSVWKNKAKGLQAYLVSLRRRYKTCNEFDSPNISGHKFDLKIVCTSLSLYFLGGCSLRGVRQVLLCIQLNYGIFKGDLPSKSSIDNWIQKVGYDDYMNCGEDVYKDDYGIIMDESMVIGQQRMMVVLGLPAIKTSEEASNLSTVRLLYMAVRPSWKGVDIEALLKNVVKKMGKLPLYVISDGNSNLIRGIKDSGLVRLCDVGHEIAKFIEQTYKHQEVFKAFSTAVAGVKFREVMKETAYLLPPKQRAIARFMNLGDTVKWSRKMLAILPKLTQVEQQTFGYLKDYDSLIRELSAAFEMVHQMLKIIKNEGISYGNIEKCLIIIQYKGSKIPDALIIKIKNYFNNEKEKLPDETTIWHASSDVIESLFGKFKQRAATNKLNGVTPLILSLGLYGQFQEPNDQTKDKVRNALQDVSMTDLKEWKQRYLVENQLVRRNKAFKM
jgi:hypothetical protein